MMFKKIALLAGLGLALSATAEAQTPRKGGTIRMTAPYGSSFTSMDIHTTPRAQDEIVAKGLFGDDTKIGSRLYLLATDGARIHVVDRSFADSVGQPLDLRHSASG